jgi:O-methyltransferase
MIRKAVKLLVEPKKYMPVAFQMVLQYLCSAFQNTSFFMQGQMDIHPKSRWHSSDFVKLTGGYFPKNDDAQRQICNLEPWDTTRRDMLILLLRTVIDNKVDGDIAEVGVYKGSTAKLIHYYVPERKLHLFDTFEGFTNRCVAEEKEKTGYHLPESKFADTSIDIVKRHIDQKNDNVLYYRGYFPDSAPPAFHELRFAFLHLDADLYAPTLNGLKFFYPLMSPKGMILVHDYNAWPGARKAVDDFFYDKEELPIPMPDKSGSVLIVKRN